jgi:uncharacterized membrane protein YkvA (DUF1232 family)
MSDLDARCLDAFPQWLRSLADDARALSALVGDASVPAESRRPVAGALNYLFKSLDLIPDGIEDLGFIDDAFVFRVAAASGVKAGDAHDGTLARLATDVGLIAEFLGPDHGRLERYVSGLTAGAVRGRSVDDIVSDASVAQAFVADVASWAQSYQVPSFARDAKNLVKLRSFLTTKLPNG